MLSSLLLPALSSLLLGDVRLGLATQEATDWDACEFAFRDKSNIFVKYNLAQFRRETYPFEVEDSLDRNWIYYFDVCGKIGDTFYYDEDTGDSNGVSESCYNSTGPCRDIVENEDGSKYCAKYHDTVGDQPYALQQKKDTTLNIDKCFWLGANLDLESMPDYNVSLLDENDSAKGMVLEYLNGAWCQAAGRNRAIRIKFICPDTGRFEYYVEDEVVIEEEEVDEHPTCVYTMEYESPLACPLQCQTKKKDRYSVCSARGICATDPNLEEVRCMCDDGYAGDQCQHTYSDSKEVKEKHSGLVAAIVISIILLVILIAMAVYFGYQIKMKEEEARGGLQRQFMSPLVNDDGAASKGDGITMDQVGLTKPSRSAPHAPVTDVYESDGDAEETDERDAMAAVGDVDYVESDELDGQDL
jgi:type II secretory pathway pseudopilin PulG